MGSLKILSIILMVLLGTNFAQAEGLLTCSGWKDKAAETTYHLEVPFFDVLHSDPYSIKIETFEYLKNGQKKKLETLQQEGYWLIGGGVFAFRFKDGALSGNIKETDHVWARGLFKRIDFPNSFLSLKGESTDIHCFFKINSNQLTVAAGTFLSSDKYLEALNEAKKLLPEGFRINIAKIENSPAPDSTGHTNVKIILEAEKLTLFPPSGTLYGQIIGSVYYRGGDWKHEVVSAKFEKNPEFKEF